MAHKVHPTIFRIKKLNDWNSRWFNIKKTPQFLEEDFKIREFLKKKLKKSSLEKIEIERFQNKLNIIIWTAKPGFIIGRGGEGIEILKKELEKILEKQKQKIKTEIKLEIMEVKNFWLSAELVSQSIAQQIEKRTPYRKVLKQALEKVISQKEAKGCRIEISGRLNGVEIARRDWLQKGQMPRQTLRSDIDYAQSEAHCTYGTIGIKVWIYKGEKFE